MRNILYVGLIAGIAVVAVLIGIFAATGSSQQTSQLATAAVPDQPKIGGEEFRDKWEADEKVAIQKANSNPEILKYTRGAIGLSSEFYPAALVGDNTDRMYMHVSQNRTVTGDWRTAYTETYSGRYEIIVDFTGDQITNVQVTSEPDESFTLAYSEQQKSLINLALQDPSLQKLLEGKEWFVRHIHSTLGPSKDCAPGSCSYLIFDKVDRYESVTVLVNSEISKVLSVIAGPAW